MYLQGYVSAMKYVQTQTDTQRCRHMTSSAGHPANLSYNDLARLDVDRTREAIITKPSPQALNFARGHC